jgi:hypothetical protein
MTGKGGKRPFACRAANDRPWDLAVIPDGDCEQRLSAGADLLVFAGAATSMRFIGRLLTDKFRGVKLV